MGLFETKANPVAKEHSYAEKKIQESMRKKEELSATELELQIAIGKKYVEAHIGDEVCEEDYAEDILKIRDIVAEQKMLDVKILAFSGKRKCENCGSTIDLYSKFCNSCGNKLEEMDIPQILGGRICSTCGAVSPADSMFCISCGTKIDDAQK